jgi:hypothetical protein
MMKQKGAQERARGGALLSKRKDISIEDLIRMRLCDHLPSYGVLSSSRASSDTLDALLG